MKEIFRKRYKFKYFIGTTDESLKGQLIYSKPNFAYTDNTLNTSIRSVNNDFLSLYGYETDELGVSVGTRFEQYENLFFSPELDLTLEDLSTNSNASSTLKNQEGNYSDFYFNYVLDYDKETLLIIQSKDILHLLHRNYLWFQK